MPRLLGLLKVGHGMLVILFLIQGDAFVQQGFRLLVMMRNGRAGGKKAVAASADSLDFMSVSLK